MKVDVVNHELLQKVKDNNGMCLCILKTKCMCDEFKKAEVGEICHCGIYKKTEK